MSRQIIHTKEKISKLYEIDKDGYATKSHKDVAIILNVCKPRAYQLFKKFELKFRPKKEPSKEDVFKAFIVESKDGNNYYSNTIRKAAKELKVGYKSALDFKKKYGLVRKPKTCMDVEKKQIQ